MNLLIAGRTLKAAEFIGNVIKHARADRYAFKYVTTSQEIMNVLNDGYTPDAVVVDLDLPEGEQGFALLKALSANDEYGFPKFAIVSGNHNKWVPRLKSECRATQVIFKPLKSSAILKAINEAVGSGKEVEIHKSLRPANDAVSFLIDGLETPKRNFGAVICDEVIAILQSFKAKSDSFYGHSIHVACVAVGICRAIRRNGNGFSHCLLDEDEAFLAGLLHDAGKLYVPDRILLKNGELTERERETMTLHTIWGADFLRNIKSLKKYAVYAHQHHEPSYPSSLPLEEITVPSRVINIADKFAAMVVNRQYRKAIPPTNTVELLMADLQGFLGGSAGLVASYLESITANDLNKYEYAVSSRIFSHHAGVRCR